MPKLSATHAMPEEARTFCGTTFGLGALVKKRGSDLDSAVSSEIEYESDIMKKE